MHRLLFTALALFLCVAAQGPDDDMEECEATHPLVGERFALTTFSHDVRSVCALSTFEKAVLWI